MDNLIFLDTETTGNDKKKDRLCQVSYKIGDNIYNCYFKPPIPMSVKAMSVTHITNKMLENKESFENSSMKKELNLLLKDKIMVAHNAIFDKAMLENEGLEVPKFICTLRVARFFDEENVIPEYNLQFLRYYLDLEIEAIAHDAEGDVLVLEALFGRLLSKVMEKGLSEEEAIKKMVEISSTPSMIKKFTFGKYKDKTIEEVLKIDKGYLEWLLTQKINDGGTDEDWIYSLKTHLAK